MTVSKKLNKSFGILFFIIFFIYGIWPLLSSNELRIWSIVVGVVFLILGLLNSKLLSPLVKLWIKFGELLGKIIAPIVMFFIYFSIITPIGLIMKIFGKDLLNIKYSKINSYWIKRPKDLQTMKKQF
tara:strand:- start:107 stop:487 length:381 start_codon:yes stop_codon:yes gene_type:complete